MRKITVNKRATLIGFAVLMALGASSTYYQSRLRTTRTAFNTAFFSCIKPRQLSQSYDPYSDPTNIPCFQQSLKVSHDSGAEFALANLLTEEGRYEEARPLYESLAHSYGINAFTGKEEMARQMLKPGAMAKMKAEDDHMHKLHREALALTAKNQQEEKTFLEQHAMVRNGAIVEMSEANKAQWLQMREQHAKAQKSLGLL